MEFVIKSFDSTYCLSLWKSDEIVSIHHQETQEIVHQVCDFDHWWIWSIAQLYGLCVRHSKQDLHLYVVLRISNQKMKISMWCKDDVKIILLRISKFVCKTMTELSTSDLVKCVNKQSWSVKRVFSLWSKWLAIVLWLLHISVEDKKSGVRDWGFYFCSPWRSRGWKLT